MKAENKELTANQKTLTYAETTLYLTVRYYHVTDTFQSESTLYNCLNIKELLAESQRSI